VWLKATVSTNQMWRCMSWNSEHSNGNERSYQEACVGSERTQAHDVLRLRAGMCARSAEDVRCGTRQFPREFTLVSS
jgi:hypothetical protein